MNDRKRPGRPVAGARWTAWALAGLVAAGAAAACSTSKEHQLERVAKDWSMVIRASQVIPVYPLTEDLQPGDVFLVTTPVQDQVRIYRQRGFLPLDQPVTRLAELDADYQAFYAPSASRPQAPRNGGGDAPVEAAAGADPLRSAPRAAFPTYDFEVDSSAGMKLALPVSGVPVGLGLMRSDRATGSIAISDAYTYGLSSDYLLTRLRDWARRERVEGELAMMAGSASETLFLRVVSRVYLTGAVVVSLHDQTAIAEGADAGVSPEIGLLDSAAESSLDAFEDARERISGNLSSDVPGGSLRLAQASQRNVTLSERFERPLVIGYLGFDVPVLRNGELGAPIATLSMLENRDRAAPIGELTPSQRRRELVGSELLLRTYRLEFDALGPADVLAGCRELVSEIAFACERLPEENFAEVQSRACGILLATDEENPAALARGLVFDFLDAADRYAAVDELARNERVVAMLELAHQRAAAGDLEGIGCEDSGR